MQYSKNGILRYEQIFGIDYVSVGGESTTEKFCEDHLHDVLEHEKNKVLDIGCGIGGSAFYMARNYGVDVYGIDLAQVGIFSKQLEFHLLKSTGLSPEHDRDRKGKA